MWVLYAGVFLFSFILIARLFSIQVIHGDEYREQAERQYSIGGNGNFDRGSIFFTEKNGERISAATVEAGYTIAINPKLIVNAQDVYNKINSITPLDKISFLEKTNKKDDPYEEVVKRLDQEDALSIQKFDITGVTIEKDKWRLYPGGKTAAHLLGFVGYKDDMLAGRYGLEAYYDDVLQKNHENLYSNFFAEAFSLSKSFFEKNGWHEGDVVTSIEPSVQGFLETSLAGIMKKWNSNLSGGIIMDPKTGEIYALANAPDFDPNTFGKEKNSSVFLNPIVESTYEMGSIIKPLTMAAGLDAGVVKPETTYDDKGFVVVDNSTIKNFDGKGRGVVPMQEVLDESLNTGAVFVMQKLGKDRFRDYMTRYGLEEETGIDLPGEVRGSLKNLDENAKNKRMVEYATAAFGQGISMTPIATARALSVLANKGKIVTPYVVKEINYAVGFSRTTVTDNAKPILRPETSETITRMLVHVVDNSLLGGTVKMEHYSIAAKTGTAQMAREDGKGYYDDRYLHTFFGYFPAYNPRFIVFLYTKYPKNVKYAAYTLTAPFMDITKFLINYYNIPPDR
ncbi:MAG: penicillin-binding protein 2 [bacterium]|nr:penicillin-binding protein 2 [bacterium]